MRRITCIVVVLTCCARVIADSASDSATLPTLEIERVRLRVEEARLAASLASDHPDLLAVQEKIKVLESQIATLQRQGRPTHSPFTNPRDYSRDPGTGMPVGRDALGELSDKVAWLYSELTKAQAATSTVSVAELKRQMETISVRLGQIEKRLTELEKKPESNKASENIAAGASNSQR
jgi:hypothetical protein